MKLHIENPAARAEGGPKVAFCGKVIKDARTHSCTPEWAERLRLFGPIMGQSAQDVCLECVRVYGIHVW